MFGWDFQNSKSDRIKLFLFLLVVFLLVGFVVSTFFRSMNKDKVVADDQYLNSSEKVTEQGDSPALNSDDSKSLTEEPNEYDQNENFSAEELESTKQLAIQFVTAFHNYDADKPQEYLENAKPYMTDALYKKMNKNGRREVIERSYLTLKETDITQVVNKSKLVVRWNVIARGEARSVDGKVSNTEDWYLVGIRNIDGEWKVEDVRVNVPN